jgi:hypothetical protein
VGNQNEKRERGRKRERYGENKELNREGEKTKGGETPLAIVMRREFRIGDIYWGSSLFLSTTPSRSLLFLT